MACVMNTQAILVIPEEILSDLSVDQENCGTVRTSGGYWKCICLSVTKPGTGEVMMRELVYSAVNGAHDYMRTRIRPDVELTERTLAELARAADFREVISNGIAYRFTLVVDTRGVGLQVMRDDGVATVFTNAPPTLGDYTREDLLSIGQNGP